VSEQPSDGPVVHDRRKVDPVTGEPRRPAPEEPATAPTDDGGAPASDNLTPEADEPSAGDDTSVEELAANVVAEAELTLVLAQLDERTEDLARAQADFANYRRRVERDRELAGEFGRAEVLASLMGVLDDIAAARSADALTGPLASMADKLEEAVAKFDFFRYGEEGEPFDPEIHDALMHQTSPEATGPTIALVIQPGYRIGKRVLRPAKVGVLDAE